MDAEIRPIKIFGVALIILAVVGVLFFLFGTSKTPFFSPTSSSNVERVLFYLVMADLAFYFLTGLGVIFQKKWGYILFKLFLYIMFLGFPGTIISYATLSYMRRHQIKRYFGFSMPVSSAAEIAVPIYMKATTAVLSIGYLALFLWMMIAF